MIGKQIICSFCCFLFFAASLSSFTLKIGIEDEREKVSCKFFAAATIKQAKNYWKIKKGEVVSFRVKKIVPGEIRYHVGLEVIDFKDRGKISKRLEFYRKKGLKPKRPRILGGKLKIAGRLVNDNRRYFILAGYSNDELETRKRIDALALLGLTGFLFRERIKAGASPVEMQRHKGWLLLSNSDPIQIFCRKQVLVKNVAYGRGYSWGGRINRKFLGPLTIYIDGKGTLGIYVKKHIEDYLQGVLPSEISPKSPFETLKAQAVCARGDILSKLKINHIGEPFSVCSEVHCQVFSGQSRRAARTDQALAETRGKILLSENNIAEALYSACCGGATENNENVWKSPPRKHLRGHIDALGMNTPDLSREENVRVFIARPPELFCGKAGYRRKGVFRWEKSLTPEKIQKLLKDRKELGLIKELIIHKRGVSGRIMKLQIVGEKDRLFIQKELPIRKALGNLKSALFSVDEIYTAAGKLSAFRLKGAGWGHGVGLCQRGAMAMGGEKISYKRILAHYYQNTKLVTISYAR
ncbi:SpoIID/LytB domain-containing protein [Candidatus Riflebacteria bacterium]